MVDYYKIIGVRRSATAKEIKSAYRRLARRRHPDVNGGSERATRDFALLTRAYKTLSDPQERAFYDAQWETANQTGSSSVLSSDNPHAQRFRSVIHARTKWDHAVDSWLETDRRETAARQRAVFAVVTLFISTFFVTTLKPKFWVFFGGFTGRAILITLFLIGLWHLVSRLRESFAVYTYDSNSIHESLMGDDLKEQKPFTRSAALTFLIGGTILSALLGTVAGPFIHYIVSDMRYFFDDRLHFDLMLYPPIAVLIIDTMHAIASKIDS